MTKTYNEVEFDIDIISNQYNTKDPFIIQQKAKENLNSNLEILDIIGYLDIEGKKEVNKYSIKMKEIF